MHSAVVARRQYLNLGFVVEVYSFEVDHSAFKDKSTSNICLIPPNATSCYAAIGCCYLLLALAIVADEYFVPALTLIGEYFELSEDVTGATLMAMGGSASELSRDECNDLARSAAPLQKQGEPLT